MGLNVSASRLLHQKQHIKRAGVAGIALRAEGVNAVIPDRLRASWCWRASGRW